MTAFERVLSHPHWPRSGAQSSPAPIRSGAPSGRDRAARLGGVPLSSLPKPHIVLVSARRGSPADSHPSSSHRVDDVRHRGQRSIAVPGCSTSSARNRTTYLHIERAIFTCPWRKRRASPGSSPRRRSARRPTPRRGPSRGSWPTSWPRTTGCLAGRRAGAPISPVKRVPAGWRTTKTCWRGRSSAGRRGRFGGPKSQTVAALARTWAQAIKLAAAVTEEARTATVPLGHALRRF